MPPRLQSTAAAAWRKLVLTGIVVGSLLLMAPSRVTSAGQAAKKPAATTTPAAQVQAPPRPSLDTLKARVTAFWGLLVRGQKLEAMQFVELSGRKNFDAWQLVQISEPRIATMGFTSKAEEMSVTVEIKRTFPPFPTAFSWPVTQNWLFRNGTWYVRVEQASATVLFPTTPGKAGANALSAEETGKRQMEIRSALQFETSLLEFGRVNRGDRVSLNLPYKLAGSESYSIHLNRVPVDCFVRNIKDRILPAGNDQTIQMELLTQTYAGEVSEKFTAVISHRDVEVPFDFQIHGYVYVPVYATPSTLTFRTGERTKEVMIKNDSKSDITLSRLESKDFEVTPLPQKLASGRSCTLKVSVLKDTDIKNLMNSISLSFDKPVEDMGGLDLSIVRNYEVIDPEKARELQLRELLRRSGAPVKK